MASGYWQVFVRGVGGRTLALDVDAQSLVGALKIQVEVILLSCGTCGVIHAIVLGNAPENLGFCPGIACARPLVLHVPLARRKPRAFLHRTFAFRMEAAAWMMRGA